MRCRRCNTTHTQAQAHNQGWQNGRGRETSNVVEREDKGSAMNGDVRAGPAPSNEKNRRARAIQTKPKPSASARSCSSHLLRRSLFSCGRCVLLVFLVVLSLSPSMPRGGGCEGRACSRRNERVCQGDGNGALHARRSTIHCTQKQDRGLCTCVERETAHGASCRPIQCGVHMRRGLENEALSHSTQTWSAQTRLIHTSSTRRRGWGEGEGREGKVRPFLRASTVARDTASWAAPRSRFLNRCRSSRKHHHHHHRKWSETEVSHNG